MRKIFFNGKVYTGEMPLQDSFIVEDNKFIFAGNFNEAQNFIDENTLSVHVRRLRQKLEKDPKNPVYIVTVFGIGYIFGKELP